MDKYDVIYGAISQFNFDDIKFYVNFGESKFIFKDVIGDKDKYRTLMIDKLEKKYGTMQYVMSSETLNKVLAYLERKKISL